MVTGTGLNLSKITPKDIGRFHKVVTVILIILVAMLAAKLISAIVGMSITDVKNTEAPGYKKIVRPLAQDLTVQRLAKYDVIVSRNVFNSKNEIPEDILISTAPGDTTKKSTLDVELVGTIVVNDPSRSVAAIALKTQKKV